MQQKKKKKKKADKLEIYDFSQKRREVTKQTAALKSEEKAKHGRTA